MHRPTLCCGLFLLGLTSFLLGCARSHVEPTTVTPTGKTPQSIPLEKSRVPTPSALWSGPDNPPPGLRTAALEKLHRSQRTSGSWSLFGPSNVPGRLSALAIDPLNNQRIWAGSAAGGVFLSTNGGGTWTPVFDDQAVFSIGAVAVDPSTPDTVYVGTGEEIGSIYNYEGEGVFKTTDGGATWNYVGLAEVRRIGRIAVDPVDPQRVFVAGGGSLWTADQHRGVYRSLDGGATWSRVLHVSNGAGAVDVQIDPGDPDRIYAAIWQRSWGGGLTLGGPDSGIYRSLDGGTTWTQLTAGLPAGSLGRIGLAVAQNAPQHVYAVIGSSGFGLLGVWRTDDGGDNWNQTATPFPGGSVWYFGQIRVDPANWKFVYLLDVFLWESFNAGVTFNQRTTYHADHHDLIPQGTKLLVANDGGYGEVDTGSVTRSNTPNTQFYDICTDQ
ncbi:MAG: hypothetical protein OEV00_03825, partial [Acidobacteriota bacterium]|nr:hypothetical protein [Acidobacteriota bacterium]